MRRRFGERDHIMCVIYFVGNGSEIALQQKNVYDDLRSVSHAMRELRQAASVVILGRLVEEVEVHGLLLLLLLRLGLGGSRVTAAAAAATAAAAAAAAAATCGKKRKREEESRRGGERVSDLIAYVEYCMEGAGPPFFARKRQVLCRTNIGGTVLRQERKGRELPRREAEQTNVIVCGNKRDSRQAKTAGVPASLFQPRHLFFFFFFFSNSAFRFVSKQKKQLCEKERPKAGRGKKKPRKKRRVREMTYRRQRWR